MSVVVKRSVKNGINFLYHEKYILEQKEFMDCLSENLSLDQNQCQPDISLKNKIIVGLLLGEVYSVSYICNTTA